MDLAVSLQASRCLRQDPERRHCGWLIVSVGMEEVCSPFVPDSLSLVYMLLVFDLIMKDGRTLHCSNPLSDRLFVVTALLWLWHLTGANTGVCTSNCVTLSTPSTDILHFQTREDTQACAELYESGQYPLEDMESHPDSVLFHVYRSTFSLSPIRLGPGFTLQPQSLTSCRH